MADDEADMTVRVVSDVPQAVWNAVPSNRLYDRRGNPQPSVLKNHLRREGRLLTRDALDIITRAKLVFAEEPNLLELEDPITVCGDVHGQFFDLLKLFSVGGDPKDVRYLFLGDYVDRGFFGTECCFLLFTYKILYPDRLFMLRGNHECRHLTEHFNFKEECLFKYNLEVYDAFMDCFDHLPLGCILNGRFFCVHGGISPELTTIEDLNVIHRFREPPSTGLFCDLLWADPMDEEEEEAQGHEYFVENQLRGCSHVYSHLAVESFLRTNHLLSVIRAHEAQDEGYRLYEKSSDTGFPAIICIFSAPNYCDVYKNKGAIIRFKDNLMNIRQFNEMPHPYYLPNFMNAFNWSMPFVIDKILGMFRTILSLVVDDDEEDVAPSDANPRERLDLTRMRKILSKVRAVGRMSRLYGTVVRERESIILLRGLAGGVLPRGIISRGREAIQEAICNFEAAKNSDRPNEKRPPLKLTTLHDRSFESRTYAEERRGAADSLRRRVRLETPVEANEIPFIEFITAAHEIEEIGEDEA